MSPPEGTKSEKLGLTEMTASTGIGPPKQGYVSAVSNPVRALVPFAQLHQVSSGLRNSTKVPEPTMIKTLVKKDEPDKEKRKGRQNESTSQQSSHQRLRSDVFDFTATAGTQHL